MNKVEATVVTVLERPSDAQAEESSLLRTHRKHVGMFEVGAVTAIFGRSSSDDGQWWWEDEAIASSVFLEPCLDFVAMSPAPLMRSSAATAPYIAAQLQESLLRAIPRLLASDSGSVVVYRTGGGSPGSNAK